MVVLYELFLRIGRNESIVTFWREELRTRKLVRFDDTFVLTLLNDLTYCFIFAKVTKAYLWPIFIFVLLKRSMEDTIDASPHFSIGL